MYLTTIWHIKTGQYILAVQVHTGTAHVNKNNINPLMHTLTIHGDDVIGHEVTRMHASVHIVIVIVK